MQFIGLARFFHGISGNDKWAGVSQIASGDGSAVVSASNVLSGYPILLTRMGSGGPNFPLVVDSIVDNTSFAVEVSSGTALAPIPFSWVVFRD
jgi:hypothetical protein